MVDPLGLLSATLYSLFSSLHFCLYSEEATLSSTQFSFEIKMYPCQISTLVIKQSLVTRLEGSDFTYSPLITSQMLHQHMKSTNKQTTKIKHPLELL